MKISKKLFIAPLMGLLGLALTQPVSAETFCTKTTKTVTTTTSSAAPYMVERMVESPVTVEDSTCAGAPLSSFDRVIEKPVVIRESPVMVERPVVVDSPVVVQRDAMMAQPIIIKKHGHHLLHVGVEPIGGVSLF